MTALIGKTALVTGTSARRGIGRAIAKRLAADGASVVVADLPGDAVRADLQAELVTDLRAMGVKAVSLDLDVTSDQSIQMCIEQARATFGTLDILVNNAGSLAGSKAFMATTPSEWEASFKVNILGPMMLAQAVIPQMIAASGGRIINIGSTGSLGAEPGFGAYTAMKHGLVGLTKTLAAEFGPHGILCNTVCPGYIATDMHEAATRRLADENGITVEAMRERRYGAVALRSAGLPEDVAHAVAFLAGPHSTYITGVNFPVSGGVPCGI